MNLAYYDLSLEERREKITESTNIIKYQRRFRRDGSHKVRLAKIATESGKSINWETKGIFSALDTLRRQNELKKEIKMFENQLSKLAKPMKHRQRICNDYLNHYLDIERRMNEAKMLLDSIR